MNYIETKMLKLNDKMQNLKMLKAIRQGVVMTIPATIIGAFALIGAFFPLEVYQNFIASFMGGVILDIFTFINDSTLGVISLIMAICIPYSYSFMLKEEHSAATMPVISTVAYVVFIGFKGDKFELTYFGGEGVFAAILAASLVCFVFEKFDDCQLYNKAFNRSGMDSVLVGALKGMLPATIIIFTCCALRIILLKVTGTDNIQQFFSKGATTLYKGLGNNIITAVLFELSVQILWFLGVHGNNVFNAVSANLFEKAVTENQLATAAGKEPTQILSKTFLDTFVNIGGSGTILCLIIATLIFVRNRREKSIVRIGVIPSLFNISEIITFGLPIVFNPLIAIPFILVPIVSTIIAYLATYIGLIPVCTHTIEWTTPVFISAYEATGSVKAVIVQIFIVIVGVLIYRPFVKMYALYREENMKKQIKELVSEMMRMENENHIEYFTKRRDDLGGLARMLVNELSEDIDNGRVFVMYQPQINSKEKCVGAEALIRWNHQVGGMIYPPLTIQLAKEGNILDKLEKYLMDTVCSDLGYVQNTFDDRFIKISINATAYSLKSEAFFENMDVAIKSNHIERKRLWVELTEQEVFKSDDEVETKLLTLKEKGHKLLIDDFGMGRTSVMYLQTDVFDFVKFDGSIVKNMLENERNCEIISSIVSLSENLGFDTIAEYVETKQQRDKLEELGCRIYQGYYYSKPVVFSEFIKVIEKY